MSDNDNINLVATVVVKEEYLEEYLKFFEDIVKESRLEKGVLQYELNQDLQIKNKLYVLEKYENLEAIETHKNTKHFNEFVKFGEGKVTSLDISLMKKLF